MGVSFGWSLQCFKTLSPREGHGLRMGRAGLQAEATVHTGLATMPGGPHREARSGPFSTTASQAQLSPIGQECGVRTQASWVCIPAPLPLAEWLVGPF